MNSFRSSSMDSRPREPLSSTSLAINTPRSFKSNMKKVGSQKKIKAPNFWTQRILPIEDQNENPTTVKSIRFATCNQVHQYAKQNSKIQKQKINCLNCCSLI